MLKMNWVYKYLGWNQGHLIIFLFYIVECFPAGTRTQAQAECWLALSTAFERLCVDMFSFYKFEALTHTQDHKMNQVYCFQEAR